MRTTEVFELHKRPSIEQSKKLTNMYIDFERLIAELKKRDLPSEIAHAINQQLDEINSFSGSNKDLIKFLRKAQLNILKLIEKELKLLPKNHYRNMWMAIGMAAFGIPFGVAFGASLGNMAFIAIGIPIGMAIGIGIGTGLDKKAFNRGNQLDLEIK